MASFQWAGFDALMAGLGRLADPDPTSLLQDWEQIIIKDNRRGILAGTDKDGNAMPRVTYRPVAAGPKRATKRQKNSGGARGVFAGLGPHAAGLNNNLTGAEYRRLGGPPLAPRGANSRVITNLVTDYTTSPVGGEWSAFGYWDEVVSTTGEPFLMAHFTGASVGKKHRVTLPTRDLRGVRPQGRNEALRALQRWGASILKAIG